MPLFLTLLLLMLLLLLLSILFFVFKPWRFFLPLSSSSSPSSSTSIKASELERPLLSADDIQVSHNQTNEFPLDYDPEGACSPNQLHFRIPQDDSLVQKQISLPSNVPLGDSLVLDVIHDHLEDVDATGQTLVFPPAQFVETPKHRRSNFESDRLKDFVQGDISDQRSCLTLEVNDGPSRGLRCSVQSTNTSRLPLTLGRVSPSDLLLNDSEVSGKHAQINWNVDKMRWELVDMGSLNGTQLNSQPINNAKTGSRHWSDPVDLANGDIITLGTTSKAIVHITKQNQQHIPFGVGMASDPMALRRGGKKLPMQDVCYYEWPLPGLDQFGVFGICDGHGGDGAAKSASRLFPEIIGNLLSNSLARERVLSLRDASEILRDAFAQTEAGMNHDCEGCTATVLLVWVDGDKNLFAQCANVGDSTCILCVDGKHIKMTEDHKVANHSERLRIEETGDPLKNGEKRLHGMNLARMLGDKFLKQQDSRFSSEPYISQVMHIDKACRPFAILASDGLWDVISMKKATELVLQMRERYATDREKFAERIANSLLNEAKTQRTKDNTCVIFLDFDTCRVES
ncbi:hypothetical protein HN51_029224 [Arachis hypogaea]|uniref:protein-serine/threonine phosphatase n=1 Tax=Arachis hypogaea TaxID=3818 RepID=A0A445BFH4_ARAHY|nr:protein phosphatase 2C 70 isoform X1 [Arachis hypogaea]QHO35808.1 Protein phosphatase 2C [Arachis hypogaea]RYR37427.1 hypothetical protein Ahy_A09g042317 [Arachis hypogaea]